jgi:target of rapamycin complex subunit LST8
LYLIFIELSKSTVLGPSSSMASPVILVTGGYDHKIRYWDAASGVCTRSIGFGESQINCLQISLDKSLLAGGGNPMINLYDVNSNDDRPLVSYDGHSGNVMGLGFHRDQRWLFSGAEDGTVRVWDPRTNNTSRKYDCGAAVNTVVLHPNEADLISGDQDGNVKVWDLQADKLREEFNPAPDFPIRSLSMSLDASMLAVGSHRGRLFVYNATPDKVLNISYILRMDN